MDVMLTPEAAKQLDAARSAMRAAKAKTVAAEDIRRAAVINARESGATLVEIAKALGISHGRVTQIINDAR